MRLPEPDRDTLKRLRNAAELLDQHAHVITNALRCHAEAMEKAAEQAKAAYAAGHSSPLITRQGFRMASELLADTARQERDVADAIDSWTSPEADHPEHERPRS